MNKPKTIAFNKKPNVFTHMSFEEIMKRFDSLESESEKKHLLEYLEKRETSEENLTDTGLIVSDKMLEIPENLKEFKKWREEKLNELHKKSLNPKIINKLKWNCEVKQVESLFKSLENSGYIKKISKKLLNNHFIYKKNKSVPMKSGVEKIVWLKGPTKLIWFLNYLMENKFIDHPVDKAHFAGEYHFCKPNLKDFDKRYLNQGLTNKLHHSKPKEDLKEEYYPDLAKLIKETLSI